MVTVDDYIKKAEFVRNNLLKEQEKIILQNKTQIIKLNIDAFQSGKGSDGLSLNSSSIKYSGRYSLFTNLMNPNKKAGDLYDFTDSGVFVANLRLKLTNALTRFNIFSTGTGAGDKSIFFRGYTNLFGLDDKNEDFVNHKIIYPEIMKFIKKYL